MAEGDLVDQLRTYALTAGSTGWRMYWDAYGPRTPHPHPDGRMALMQDVPSGNVGRGGLFLATTPDGACWETLLRDLQPRNGHIYLPRAALIGRSLVQLRARVDVPLVDLTWPARRNLFVDRDATSQADVNALWKLILESPDHTQSHHAAAELAALATDLGLLFAGATWLSAQDQGAKVHLLYAPPYDPASWDVIGDPIALPSAAGIAAMRHAAAVAHMTLVLTGSTNMPSEDDDQ